jgi:septum site-determining protein MinC
MTIPITIKGIREGLLIALDEGEWEEVLPSLVEHLDAQPDFFRGARAILRLGARSLFAADVARLRSLLADRGITLQTVLSESESTLNAARSLGMETALRTPPVEETPLDTGLSGADAVVLRQTLRSGNCVEFPGSVLVLGDVNPGAEIIAGGSVVVWGRLKGTVHAGAEGDETAVVCALDLSPMQLRIAGHIATSPPRRGFSRPETAILRDGQLVAEPWNPKEKNAGGGS